MHKSLKNYLLLAQLFILPTLSFAMKRSGDIVVKKEPLYKKIKQEITKEIATPDITKDPTQLRQYIIDFCRTYNDEINTLSKNILKYFQSNSGLTPDNWECFIQRAKTLDTFKKTFASAPATFQQSISSDIAQHLVTNLKNNCHRNGICFEKINIIASHDVPEFSIQTPFYDPHPKIPGKFIFSPDLLYINYDQYKKNSDFFNICIVAAFRQEIMRVMHLYNLTFQHQTAQQIDCLTKQSKCVNFNAFAKRYASLEEHHTAFIRQYGFRIGILRLGLKNRRIACIVDYYLTNNPALCSRYGITQEDCLFFQNMKKIDVLKEQLQELKSAPSIKKETNAKEICNDYSTFLQENELGDLDLDTILNDKT